MKIFSFLFIAAISFFSFNSFTADHTDPVKSEAPYCTADCGLFGCSVSCGSSGGDSHCSCTFGIPYCECDGSVAAPGPLNEDQSQNLNNYTDVLGGLASSGAANTLSAVNSIIALMEGGISEQELSTYVNLISQHAQAVESMPRDERMLVDSFYE